MCREARRGVATGELADLRGDPVKCRFFSLLGGLDGCVNPAGDHGYSVEIHAAGGECWGPEPDAGGVEGLASVEGHRIVVNDDPGSVECLGGRLAGEILRGEIYEDQVVVGATGNEIVSPFEEPFGEGLCVRHDAVSVVRELGLGSLVKCHSDCRCGVVVRPSLKAGKNRSVERLGMLEVAEEHRAPGTT